MIQSSAPDPVSWKRREPVICLLFLDFALEIESGTYWWKENTVRRVTLICSLEFV